METRSVVIVFRHPVVSLPSACCHWQRSASWVLLSAMISCHERLTMFVFVYFHLILIFSNFLSYVHCVVSSGICCLLQKRCVEVWSNFNEWMGGWLGLDLLSRLDLCRFYKQKTNFFEQQHKCQKDTNAQQFHLKTQNTTDFLLEKTFFETNFEKSF